MSDQPGVPAGSGDQRELAARRLDEQLPAKLRERYYEAVAFGITHNRLRDWNKDSHPGYALGCWLRDCKEQVWLFTTQFAVDWTNNCSEQAVKAAKRHQAISGYWPCQPAEPGPETAAHHAP